MGSENYLPEEALVILREAVHDPDAERKYEIMSGGFWWSDERLGEVAHVCVAEENWSFRYLVGYRTSLSQGEPRQGLKHVWEQVERECPNWPGLRPERRSSDLVKELEREWRKVKRDCIRLEREYRNRNQAEGERREQRYDGKVMNVTLLFCVSGLYLVILGVTSFATFVPGNETTLVAWRIISFSVAVGAASLARAAFVRPKEHWLRRSPLVTIAILVGGLISLLIAGMLF